MLTFNISHQFKNTHFRIRIFWAKNIQNKDLYVGRFIMA